MIIALSNNKGGVGKSIISVNLAHALANKGKKVLVIDHDSQSNATSIFLPETRVPFTLHSLYSDDIMASQCIYATPYENVDILPNETKTASLELELYQDVRNSYHLLHEKIKDIATTYDFVLIDCPPNLGIWVVMALVAADCAIIPIVAGSRFSIEGFIAAYDAIQTISNRVNHRLRFLKAVVNKVDKRTSISKVAIEHIRRQFGDRIFETSIPVNTDIEQAETARQTVIRHAPQSTGAKRFRTLADELIELLEAR